MDNRAPCSKMELSPCGPPLDILKEQVQCVHYHVSHLHVGAFDLDCEYCGHSTYRSASFASCPDCATRTAVCHKPGSHDIAGSGNCPLAEDRARRLDQGSRLACVAYTAPGPIFMYFF